MKHYFPELAGSVKFELQNPFVVIGLFIGVCSPIYLEHSVCRPLGVQQVPWF